MGRCEDYPCCGHELGCCPDFDESGNQLNMKCTCGATVPLNSRYSLCQSCLNEDNDDYEDYEKEDYFDDDYDDSMDGDHQSGLSSAGWGMDEDYYMDSDYYEE